MMRKRGWFVSLLCCFSMALQSQPLTVGTTVPGPSTQGIPVSGDFDGDGISDLAVYDRANGTWYFRVSSQAEDQNAIDSIFYVGAHPDRIPVPGDYTGDGKTDLGIYESDRGLWFVREYEQNVGHAWDLPWGDSSMQAVAGDYNGDGKYDLALFQPSTGNWFIRNLHDDPSPIAFGTQWGDSSMLPVPGDYTGDGTYDLAMFQSSTGNWFIRHVADGLPPIAFGVNWGNHTMIPVPGDFDGDGISDLAVYAAMGTWFIRRLNLRPPHNLPIAFDVPWGNLP